MYLLVLKAQDEDKMKLPPNMQVHVRPFSSTFSQLTIIRIQVKLQPELKYKTT